MALTLHELGAPWRVFSKGSSKSDFFQSKNIILVMEKGTGVGWGRVQTRLLTELEPPPQEERTDQGLGEKGWSWAKRNRLSTSGLRSKPSKTYKLMNTSFQICGLPLIPPP